MHIIILSMLGNSCPALNNCKISSNHFEHSNLENKQLCIGRVLHLQSHTDSCMLQHHRRSISSSCSPTPAVVKLSIQVKPKPRQGSTHTGVCTNPSSTLFASRSRQSY